MEGTRIIRLIAIGYMILFTSILLLGLILYNFDFVEWFKVSFIDAARLLLAATLFFALLAFKKQNKAWSIILFILAIGFLSVHLYLLYL